MCSAVLKRRIVYICYTNRGPIARCKLGTVTYLNWISRDVKKKNKNITPTSISTASPAAGAGRCIIILLLLLLSRVWPYNVCGVLTIILGGRASRVRKTMRK